VTVEVKIVRQEEGTSRDPAEVHVLEDGELVAKVIGRVEGKEGADGGFYPCVTLEIQS